MNIGRKHKNSYDDHAYAFGNALGNSIVEGMSSKSESSREKMLALQEQADKATKSTWSDVTKEVKLKTTAGSEEFDADYNTQVENLGKSDKAQRDKSDADFEVAQAVRSQKESQRRSDTVSYKQNLDADLSSKKVSVPLVDEWVYQNTFKPEIQLPNILSDGFDLENSILSNNDLEWVAFSNITAVRNAAGEAGSWSLNYLASSENIGPVFDVFDVFDQPGPWDKPTSFGPWETEYGFPAYVVNDALSKSGQAIAQVGLIYSLTSVGLNGSNLGLTIAETPYRKAPSGLSLIDPTYGYGGKTSYLTFSSVPEGTGIKFGDMFIKGVGTGLTVPGPTISGLNFMDYRDQTNGNGKQLGVCGVKFASDVGVAVFANPYIALGYFALDLSLSQLSPYTPKYGYFKGEIIQGEFHNMYERSIDHQIDMAKSGANRQYIWPRH